MNASFNIHTDENGKVTHAISTDIHGQHCLYPYRWNGKTHVWDNVSGNVTKRTLQRDDKRNPEDQLYKWA